MSDKIFAALTWALYLAFCRLEIPEAMPFLAATFVVLIILCLFVVAWWQTAPPPPRPLILVSPKEEAPKQPAPYGDLEISHFSPLVGAECTGILRYKEHRDFEGHVEITRECEKCHMLSFEKRGL